MKSKFQVLSISGLSWQKIQISLFVFWENLWRTNLLSALSGLYKQIKFTFYYVNLFLCGQIKLLQNSEVSQLLPLLQSHMISCRLGIFLMNATLGIYKILFACEKFNCIVMLKLFYSKAFVTLHKSKLHMQNRIYRIKSVSSIV